LTASPPGCALPRALGGARRGCSRSFGGTVRCGSEPRVARPSPPPPLPPPCERTRLHDASPLGCALPRHARGARRTRRAIGALAVFRHRGEESTALPVAEGACGHRQAGWQTGGGPRIAAREGTVAGVPCAAALVQYAAHLILLSGLCWRDQREDLGIGPFVRVGFEEAWWGKKPVHPLAWSIACGGLRVGRTRRGTVERTARRRARSCSSKAQREE